MVFLLAVSTVKQSISKNGFFSCILWKLDMEFKNIGKFVGDYSSENIRDHNVFISSMLLRM